MHVLIIGQSTSGKSNLAKRFATDQYNEGNSIIIYDPLKSSGWPSGENVAKFADPEKFLTYLETAQESFVYIDEAKTLWDYDIKRANKVVYTRRHQGLLIFLIAQRAKMVQPNARDQCSRVFAFKQSIDDAKELAAEFDNGVIKCASVKKGEFVLATPFASKLCKLDYLSYPPIVSCN